MGTPNIDELLRQLNGLLPGSRRSLLTGGKTVDVIVTPVEVNQHHGTGLFLQMLFSEGHDIVSIRALDQHEGEQTFGRPIKIAHGDSSRDAVFQRISSELEGMNVRRILCVPYLPDDVMTTIALHGISNAPICTYIMDDQNVAAHGIHDNAMRELLEKSTLRLAISPEMRDAYEKKFGLPFFYAPPAAPANMLPSRLHVPVQPPDARHGILIGNLWSPRSPEMLRRTVAGSGVTLSYPGGTSLPGSAESWSDAGIYVKDRIASDELVAVLRSMWFAVLPSGTLDAGEDRPWIAKYSLPSRLVYLMATSHIPVIVLGSRDTAAAHFVEQFGIGLVADYDAASFRKAVQKITDRETNLEMRRRGLANAARFVDTGMGEWLWQSLAKGAPIDRRFEDLMPAGGSA